ncbi:16872_t:CDS:10 [Entrophospora sp. SA101]|nr:16872_t:CDS:10 [Entrophospora sp. SA101]
MNSDTTNNTNTSTNIYSTARPSELPTLPLSLSSSLSNFLHQYRSRTNLTIIVKAQISFLLSRISVDNYVQSLTELNTLSKYNGQDTYFYLLRQLAISTLSSGNQNIEILNHLLIEKIKEISIDPLLLNIFCNSISNNNQLKVFNLYSFLESKEINLPFILSTTTQKYQTIMGNYDNIDQNNNLTLPKILLDLGSKCCNTADLFNEVLAKLGVNSSASGEIIKEVEVARALGVMALTTANFDDDSGSVAWNQSKDLSDNNNQNWNVEIFVSSLSELQPHLDWVKVIKLLDYPEFTIKDIKGVQLILTGFRKAVKDQQPFPIHLFWGNWNNLKGQFSFLRHLVQLSSNAFNINDYPIQKVLTTNDFPNSLTHLKSLPGILTSCPWNSLELVETLIRMADSDLHEDVKVTFELSIKQAPELICLGLAQIQKPWNSLHMEFVNRLISTFLTSHLNSTLVLSYLWHIDNKLFIESCLEMYRKDHFTITRLLDVSQELKVLNSLLEVQYFLFTIDLAALASRREYLNLEKWLQEKLNKHGDKFAHDCMEFLKQKIALEITHEVNGSDQAVRLTDEVVLKFLRVISNSNMTPENEEYFKEIRKKLAQIYPSLSTIPLDVSIPPQLEQSFPAETEEIANLYFEKVYRQEIEIDDMIKDLQRLKNSQDPRESEIFSCMIHNLFDEYQFLPKYPQRELNLTSIIFGSLIKYQLVGYVTLGVALRYILSALKNTVDSKFYIFGTQALIQFQSRLPEWPQYCSHLLQIPQLQQSHPDIIQYVKSALSANAEPVKNSINNDFTNYTKQSNKAIDKPIFTALTLDTLLAADKADYEIPSEAIQDKIFFIINNVAQNNFETKVAEMKVILKESHYKWFANYMVVKRASIELNYHQLYNQFLDALEVPELYYHILHETFSNIKVLLNSEKTVHSSSERSLLKNLGSWLGSLTLAKNKPIRHKNIAFKELLIQGYDSNRLIVVIPFVCKVLEQAGNSKVFKPPNPWSMAIIKLLVELYHNVELKLNLKFEVVVLCKSLNIELKDITPTTILNNRPPKGSIVLQTESPPPEFEKWHTNNSSKIGHQISRPPSTPLAQNPPSSLPLNDDIISNISQYITFNPTLSIFSNQPNLRKIIITPVVERSVSIASISTHELIIKDFAMEPNEEKVRNAAHLMVQNLAGSLALVTCKEPLKISMATHLRNLFLENIYSEQNNVEQAILILVSDNLELACSVIEKAAIDKAVPEIDEALSSLFSNRKKHNERTSQPYYDMSIYSGASRFANNLPDHLHLKSNGLQPQQLRVYEDFGRSLHYNNQTASIYDEHAPRSAISRQDFQINHPYAMLEMPYDAVSTAAVSQVPAHITFHQTSWSALPHNHEICILVKEIPILATQTYNRDETALMFSQKIMQFLYKNDFNFSREVYVILLEKLCEISLKVFKEVTAWLLYSDDERKFIVPVVILLIKAGLVNVVDQDLQLAKLIEDGRSVVIDFTTKLIHECVLKDPPCATRNDFIYSLDALTRLTQRGKATEANNIVINNIDEIELHDQLAHFFTEWIRVYQDPSSGEKAYTSFIQRLQQQGVLKGEEISSMFFRVCTETSIEIYLKQRSLHQITPAVAYQAIDAFSKLIVLLVKYHTDPEGIDDNVAKISYLTKILSIVILILAQAHEQHSQQFNQKPFFRLFSNLLNDLNSYEQQFQSIYFQILIALSNTFHTLQPSFFPGFTFAWFSLISHRLFMPKLLLAENQKMKDTTCLLYKGTLRILLVLLHDFPEFISGYHLSFCDVIPSTCIQLRNLILSAFPRTMRLPDPFTPNLKVDLLPEISQPPIILSDYTSALITHCLKDDVDEYLKLHSPINFLTKLHDKLLLGTSQQDTALIVSKYNIPLLNALVLYVGIKDVYDNFQGTLITTSLSMDIYKQLVVDLDPEGRYYFLSAIANQLRYPNSHTHYFSCVLLYIFAEGKQEGIKEQVTRVLLERLIVNRPHPWGLLITFIELIKNPLYNFWSHSFTRCAADIERLFESVSRSINQV